MAVRASRGAPRLVSVREWIRDHDESWIFVAIYLGLAVGLSVFVSLFWLVVVAAVHFALELIRQGLYQKGWLSIALHALWEVKLDVGLIFLALALVLYIDVVLGLLGLQSAARAAAVSRAGVRIGSRAAAWERNLRTFLLTVDEMARIGQAIIMFGRKGKEKREDGGADDPSSRADEGDGEPAAPAAEAPPTATPESPSAAALPHSANSPPSVEESRTSAHPPEELPPVWRRRWGVGDRIGMGLVLVGAILITAAPFTSHHDWRSATTTLLEELHPFPPPVSEGIEE